MSYFPTFGPYYEDSDTFFEENPEINYEVQGIFCARCNEYIGWEPIESHDCIACYYCGEYNSCICEEITMNKYE